MFKTIGHKNQKAFLQKMLQDKKIPQSYMFAGPSEVGKRTLAVEFAKALIAFDGEYHPDIITVDAFDMSVLQMRELLSTLAMSPFSAKRKVAIIDNFENASKEVSNALLKTLEEPNDSTVIILIASNYKKVLPTIVSRSHLINFGRINDEEIAKVTDKRIDEKVFAGKIGRALRYFADKEYAKFFNETVEDYTKLKRSAPAERLLSIKKIADMEDKEISEIFNIWQEIEYSRESDSHPRIKNLSALLRASESMNSNINRKLILQKALLEISAQ